MTVHTEILLIAIAVSIACAIPGVFLVLRRMSMMADAITHTVFLGIVLAFFVTEDLNSPLLLVGATVVGVGTVWLTEMIHNTGLVNEDASIGIIFPLLFSIAIILVSLYSGNAHLDVDTALLGEIAFAPFDRWIVNGTDLGPVSLWISLGVAVINLVLVMLFYKELQLSTFDPLLAGLFGFMPALIHYVLMTMVSLTVVASFQAVGAILVIGLMIGPAVIAYLWTDSVKAMLISSIIIGILVIAALGLYLAPSVQAKIKERWRITARTMNTALLCTMMIVIGYSSYALIVIRSTANTPMDQNSPEDIFTLGEYLGREQYGTRPLFYGPAFSSKVALDVKDGYCIPRQSEAGSKFVRKEKTSPDEKDSYIELPGRVEYEYAQNMFFPRMYSSSHAPLYKQWVDIKGHDVPYDQCGEMVMVNMPNQWENIKFFFSYQLNFMYWRYFMWNFAGRQNDIQGSGEIEHGNWITGIPFIDNLLVGNQELLPQDLKNNKGHNVFYCLPLILGLIGLFWQAYHSQRGIQQFWVVFFLFFMTGIAIVLYLNQTPAQPRERDYAYAGSFYAFAIWVGMGVAGIIRMLREYCKMQELPAAVLASVLCLFVPIQMAGQTWDDHDRSGRFVARDFGQNYLMTLQEKGNPIIYTNGDNDTFPLWYNQETEGFRTDARTCNLSYLQTDWYIDQMKRPAYDSPSLPITWDRVEYVEGQNEYIPIRTEMKAFIDSYFKQANELAAQGDTTILSLVHSIFGENPYELKEIINRWMLGKNDQLKELLKKTGKDIQLPLIPTDSIVMKVDKEAVRRSGMKIPEALGDSIPEYMTITLRDANGNPKRALYKSELMMLEMLANANWERPIYMAITVGSENHLGMGNHFMQEGLAYRFTPFDTDKLDSKIDSEKMYDNLMNKFKFGGIDKPGIYIDENVMRMCYTHRRIFTQLVGQLIKEGKKDKALAALDYAEKMIPSYNVPYDWANGAFQMAESYYQLGQNEKANKIIDELANKSLEYMIWYLSLNDNQLAIAGENFVYNASLLDAEVRLMEKYKSEELAKHYSTQLDQLYNEYVTRMKGK